MSCFQVSGKHHRFACDGQEGHGVAVHLELVAAFFPRLGIMWLESVHLGLSFNPISKPWCCAGTKHCTELREQPRLAQLCYCNPILFNSLPPTYTFPLSVCMHLPLA